MTQRIARGPFHVTPTGAVLRRFRPHSGDQSEAKRGIRGQVFSFRAPRAMLPLCAARWLARRQQIVRTAAAISGCHDGRCPSSGLADERPEWDPSPAHRPVVLRLATKRSIDRSVDPAESGRFIILGSGTPPDVGDYDIIRQPSEYGLDYDAQASRGLETNCK